MRDELLAKQQELMRLQQQRLELELEETRRALQEKEKEVVATLLAINYSEALLSKHVGTEYKTTENISLYPKVSGPQYMLV